MSHDATPTVRPPRILTRRAGLALALVLVLPNGLSTLRGDTEPLRAADASESTRRIEDLEKKLEELSKELAAARSAAQTPAAARLAEIERRIDVLAAQIEALRAGSAVSMTPLSPSHGLGPAAAKVYGRDRGVSIGGYGEALYENFASRRDDGSAAGQDDRLDLLRAVLYFGYKFESGIVFNSEIEYEHATTGEGAEEKGEVSVEFAYLDFPLGKTWGARAGQILVPMGFLNELHEPPIFLGARRPDVERFIIPTTWREVGAGLYGEHGPIAWRAYVQAGLDASGFSAGGIRDGRQGGSQSKAEDLALTGRVDWTIIPGLLAGASGHAGNAGQGLEAGSGRSIKARTTLYDVHADWKARGWQARALYARGRITDAAALNGALGLAGAASIGTQQRGWYVEAGYDVLSIGPESDASLIPYLRYERYDAQDEVPEGFARDPALRVRVGTLGLAFKPIPGVVIKADYQDYKNDARTGLDRFNLALGYLF